MAKWTQERGWSGVTHTHRTDTHEATVVHVSVAGAQGLVPRETPWLWACASANDARGKHGEAATLDEAKRKALKACARR